MASRYFFKLNSLSLWRRPLGALIFAGLACPLIMATQARLPLPTAYVDPKPKPVSSQFLKFASIGYWPAVTDWLWIQTLQLIGSQKHPPELKPFAYRFYELATELDPRFYDLYELAATTFGFLFKSPNDAVYFLEKGVKNINPHWTQSHMLYLMLSYYYGYELNNWVKAKESYLAASAQPGAPEYLQRMKTWLDKKGSEKELARRILKILISRTENELLKQEYQKKLNAL